MKKKTDGYILLIGCSLVFLAGFYNFLQHLDYFITRKYTKGTILNREEAVSKDGMILNIEYFDIYKEKTGQFNIKVPYSLDKEFQGKKQVVVNIIYSRWLNQYKLKGYKNPYLAIFVLDLFILGLMGVGIYGGISTLKQVWHDKNN